MSSHKPFETPIEDDGRVLRGSWRSPRNLLVDQSYGGHASVHDDETARKMGFKSAAIEGPTHFSQFVPLCHAIWGDGFLTEGCLSAAYKTAVHDGEKVRAHVARPAPGMSQVDIWMEREDGAEVLRGTASIGSGNPPSMLGRKLEALPPPDPFRVIHRDIEPGAMRSRTRVRMDIDSVMGALYPFSLRQKLEFITESSPWYAEAESSPWERPIIPFEMVSVLLHHTSADDPWLGAEPTIDLFVDQEIHMIAGPLFVGEDYEIERKVVALSGSRRTESTWVRTEVFRPGEKEVLATMLLNVASFKESYPDYEARLATIRSSVTLTPVER